jgi:hypothetical protein
MKIKNTNRPGSGFSYRALALAADPTTFRIHTAPASPVKRRPTADMQALAALDRMAIAKRIGTAMREQGKHVVSGCAAVYDRSGTLCTCGCGKRVCWRCLTTGRFCKAPVTA